MSNKIKLHQRPATLTNVPLAAITGEKSNEQPRPLRPFERDEPALPVLDEKEQERLRVKAEKANAESYERYIAPRIAAAKEWLTLPGISIATVAITLGVEQSVLEARLAALTKK